MRQTKRVDNSRVPKRSKLVGGSPSRKLVTDVKPAIRAVEKIRREAFVSAERRRIPITV